MAEMCLPCTKQRVITCKTCGITGHNSRTCKKALGVPQSEKRAAAALLKILDSKSPSVRVITCKTCGITGHNSRTCKKAIGVPQSEKRAAAALLKILDSKPRVITARPVVSPATTPEHVASHRQRSLSRSHFGSRHHCKTCGLTGHNSKTCGKPIKPEKVKQVSLQGVTMFKEPKAYYMGKQPEVKQISLLGVSMFTEPKGYSSVNAKRLAYGSKRKITCQKCGCEGHNSRTCDLSPPTTNGLGVVACAPKRTAATKRLENTLVEDFNPTNGEMRDFLLEQCRLWGIETK